MSYLDNDFKIDWRQFDNIIGEMRHSINDIFGIIEGNNDSIYNELKQNVMVEGKWFDDYAYHFAMWWNQLGKDYFVDAYKKIIDIFGNYCFNVINELNEQQPESVKMAISMGCSNVEEVVNAGGDLNKIVKIELDWFTLPMELNGASTSVNAGYVNDMTKIFDNRLGQLKRVCNSLANAILLYSISGGAVDIKGVRLDSSVALEILRVGEVTLGKVLEELKADIKRTNITGNMSV